MNHEIDYVLINRIANRLVNHMAAACGGWSQVDGVVLGIAVAGQLRNCTVLNEDDNQIVIALVESVKTAYIDQSGLSEYYDEDQTEQLFQETYKSAKADLMKYK